jgi:hypothetical protein
MESADSTIEIDITNLYVPLEKCVLVEVGNVEASVLRQLRRRYDQAPVKADNSIIGLITTRDLEELFVQNQVLTNDNALLDQSSIPMRLPLDKLLEILYLKKAILVKSDTGEIRGLIHHSDLNKPALRHVLYGIIIELELALVRIILNRYTDPWQWLINLSLERQVYLVGHWEVAKKKDIDVEGDPIHSCTLGDLVAIVQKDDQLLKNMQLTSARYTRNALNRLANLRNHVMHPIKFLISDIEDIPKLREDLQAMLSLSRILSLVHS